MERVVATLGTAAIADPNQVAFVIKASDFKAGLPILAAEGLATTETISFWVRVNEDWKELVDSSGTQEAFTATAANKSCNSPGTFGITKDVTAAAVTVVVINGD